MYERRSVSPLRFEALVRRALRHLPEWAAERMDNVDVVVQERPSPSLRARLGLQPGTDLLGLYVGTDLTRRGDGYNFALPDRIYLFRVALERQARDRRGLEAIVRRTVIHEVAHHFGISDARLREIDRY
jgi:predicted Zn-dependent protease with MMP-like domain